MRNFINEVALEFGNIDILINNAGTNIDNLSLRMKNEEWQKVIDVNLTSTFLLAKNAIKKMLKTKIWKNYKYYFSGRSYWKCRTSKLCSFKGRNYRNV